MFREAVTQQDQDAVFVVFGGLLGMRTLELLLNVSAPAAQGLGGRSQRILTRWDRQRKHQRARG